MKSERERHEQRPRSRAAHLGPTRRRPQLVELAARLYSQRGYGLSMDRLASEAGLAKAVLYDCFPAGKDELYAAVIERAERFFIEHVVEALQERTYDGAVVIRSTIEAFARFAGADPPAFGLLFGRAEMPPRMRARLRVACARAEKVLGRLLKSRLREAGIDARESDMIAIVALATSSAARVTERATGLPDDLADDLAALIAHGLMGRNGDTSIAV